MLGTARDVGSVHLELAADCVVSSLTSCERSWEGKDRVNPVQDIEVRER